MFCLLRRMEGMDAVSSTQSPLSWLPPENSHCRSMMRRGRWARNVWHNLGLPKYWLAKLNCFLPPLVCLPLKGASLRCVRWCWYWPADQGLGERLSPAGGHTWTSGRHDGAGQDRAGLLPVSITQNNFGFHGKKCCFNGNVWLPYL